MLEFGVSRRRLGRRPTVDRRTGYLLAGGTLMEQLGEHWVAFSPLSGETHLINDTTAAVVESVSREVPVTLEQLWASLAADAGVMPIDAEDLVRQALQMLVAAGLVREVPLPRAAAA